MILRALVRTLLSWLLMVWAYISLVATIIVIRVWSKLKKDTALERALRRIANTNPAPPTPPSATSFYVWTVVGLVLLFLAWLAVFVLPQLKG